MTELRTGERPQFELLAPAGNWDCIRAAVENGADAVYFGLTAGFNARARAVNFSMADLHEVLPYLHRRNVRGYVTLNTLVFSSELPALQEHVQAIAAAGTDAVLVQDVGVAALIRQLCPQLELHASTQMTLSSVAGLQLAESLGISRVVLPRELSIDEIAKLKDQSQVELEAFVHGALCVAYSGQCLTSESLGGRSANRGQCAQACRLPYDLIADEETVDLGTAKYLLSPKDLAAHALLPQMVQAGVRSFKIEGRLKAPEYVANVTRHYRDALNAAIAATPFQLCRNSVDELELSFSRGFSNGWLEGCDHKSLVPGTSSAKRGIQIGEIVASQDRQARDHRERGRRVRARLHRELRSGDGIVLEGGRLEGTEQGGRVYEVRPLDRPRGLFEIVLAHDALQLDLLQDGQNIWLTDDPKLTQRLRATYQNGRPQRKVPLDLQVTIREGAPVQVTARAASGAHCEVAGDAMLPKARNQPCTRETVKKQLGRLGATVYEIRELSTQIEDGTMVPLSEFGKVRKRMIAALDASAGVPPAVPWNPNALTQWRSEIQSRLTMPADATSSCEEITARDAASSPEATVPGNSEAANLHVLCRHLFQLEPVLNGNPSSVIVEFADIRQYGEAVSRAKEAGIPITLATPRIEKPGEANLFRALAKQSPDAFLVRNFGGIRFCQQLAIPFVADFSLNAANELTADCLMQWGAQRVTASYDLNRDQLLELVRIAPPAWWEAVIHQHMPMFHMEHCIFCAVLSPGTNKHNCGRPCDDRVVRLRDRVGMEHPLHADVGCRNTLYNAQAQSSAEIVATLLQHGVRHFRIELLDDSPQESTGILQLYQQLLGGKISSQQVWNTLHAANRVGVTRGTLDQRRNPLAIL